MPHRSRKAGSFDAHLDELVKHFDARLDSMARPKADDDAEQDGCVHDRLFAKAWRQNRPSKS